MRAGALNFLSKPVNDEELLAAVEEAVETDRVARRAQRDITLVRERLATLTPREREVLEHVVAGKLNKQIAGDLGTVEKTIKVHRARVMEKMGARSLAELARMGERLGIGTPHSKR
jgi:FixJ family two-component response regulator